MSRVCELTGKKTVSGNNVSHSKRRTKRKFYPNLHKKRYYIPEVDRWVTLKVSTEAMRNINRKGIYAYMMELEKKGNIKLILED